jgi:pyruvate-ferredoxin/flavodoxin oxidoreductase
LSDFTDLENRFKMLTKSKPEAAKELHRLAQEDINKRWKIYSAMASNGEKTSPEGAQ